jgi:hypothetical protein
VPDTNLSAFVWYASDLMRGDYKRSDWVLSQKKEAVLEEKGMNAGKGFIQSRSCSAKQSSSSATVFTIINQ